MMKANGVVFHGEVRTTLVQKATPVAKAAPANTRRSQIVVEKVPQALDTPSENLNSNNSDDRWTMAVRDALQKCNGVSVEKAQNVPFLGGTARTRLGRWG
jgi:hypothetical protein